jgi:muramoyltetrapeptide carboxypeptidase
MTASQDRRRFFQLVAAALVASTHPLGASANSSPAPRKPRTSLIKPPALKRGDLVGVVAPSGFMVDAEIERKVKGLEAAGFRVKLANNIRAARGNTGGTIAERVEDVHAMFVDREVKAVWAGRGGSGASQLLPHLDYALIRRHAKILIGYSDLTALLVAINKLSHIVTFHGPVAFASIADYSLSQIEAVLMDSGKETTIYMAADNARRAIEAPEYRLRTLKSGIAEGRLVGGNLSVLSAMIGTRFQAETKGAVVFLEDVGEAPYRVDRMLTQLAQNQDMRKIAGAMLGVFRQRADVEEDKLTMEMALNDHFANLGVPAVAGFSIGHIANQFTIPLGVRARLDTEAATLTLLENAVRV